MPWHRVVADFVVQGGDPRGDGEGGPGYTIRDEINQRPYLRGTVGMALDWADTGGSQFFITHSPQPHLDGRYTVFGQVVAGMDVVDAMRQWDLVRSIRIWDGVAWIGSDERRRRRHAIKKGGAASAPFSIFLAEAIASSPSLRPSSSWPPSLPSLPSVDPPLQVGLCVRLLPRHLR